MTTPQDSLLAALAPILDNMSADEAPLLLASLERMAAAKYRAWAESAEDAVERQGLLDCALREEAIAEFIESLNPDCDRQLRELAGKYPQAQELYDGVMEGQERSEQLRRQADGELGGAEFLLQFAAASDGAVAAQFEALACCEEANAKFLRALIR
ncbi:MAG: hypothetical protein AAF993_01500 [Pseudomonadota bacterium]